MPPKQLLRQLLLVWPRQHLDPETRFPEQRQRDKMCEETRRSPRTHKPQRKQVGGVEVYRETTVVVEEEVRC